MSIQRIAYFTQTGTIAMSTGASLVSNYLLPISSANIEVTRPVEAVTAFGQFSSLNLAQTNITTCKCSLKGYLGSGTGSIGSGLLSSFDAGVINDIVSTTQTGFMVVTVGPHGFQMTGIATNIGLDISVGGFGMFDLGFAGVGNPYVANDSTANTVIGTNTPNSVAFGIAPVTTMSIGTTGLLNGVSATSVKFSFDMPTDTLTSLGENPNASQGNLNSIICTKAPYKASLSVEGFGINQDIVDAALQSGINIGTIALTLPHGKVNSRTFSNAAGAASATFSYSAEDVSANFTTGSVAAYSQNNNPLATPTWGA